MQRGILTFTPTQAQLILSELLASEISEPTIINKFKTASQNTEPEFSLQLNAEEAELVVDLLPSPQNNENTQLTEIRKALQRFIISLQQGD